MDTCVCVTQDGIISPETDSGFIGSESSHLTPAAAQSPLHQRAPKGWGSVYYIHTFNAQYTLPHVPSPTCKTQHTSVWPYTSNQAMFAYCSMMQQCCSPGGESRDTSDSVHNMSCFFVITQSYGHGAQRSLPPPWPAEETQTGAEEAHFLLLSTTLGQSEGTNQERQWDQWLWAGKWQQWVSKFSIL